MRPKAGMRRAPTLPVRQNGDSSVADALNLERRPTEHHAIPVNVLRQWCVPNYILAVTDLHDEEALLCHVIRQARFSGARVLLAHVAQPSGVLPGHSRSSLQTRSMSRTQGAQYAVECMARKLRWVGVPCEPLVLEGHPEEKIPALARSCGVDRIIVTSRQASNLAGPGFVSIAEQVLPRLQAPACIIGPSVPAIPQSIKQNGRVTLAISLDSDIELPLSFACRFAQEHRAKLTVIHVFARDEHGTQFRQRTPVAIAAQLPHWAHQGAEFLCPLEITVREGDPAEELLVHDATTRPDTLILCSANLSCASQCGVKSLTHRIVSGARCPVIVLGKRRPDIACWGL